MGSNVKSSGVEGIHRMGGEAFSGIWSNCRWARRLNSAMPCRRKSAKCPLETVRSQGSPGPMEFDYSQGSSTPPLTVPGTGVGGPDVGELGKTGADSIGKEGAIPRKVPSSELVSDDFANVQGEVLTVVGAAQEKMTIQMLFALMSG